MAEINTLTTRQKILILTGFLITFLFFILLVLLACDAFTIPYLTPLAHFLAVIVAPLIPFFFPIHLGIFLRVCSYPRAQWPEKTRWIFLTACWGVSHFQRAVSNTWKIWGPAWENRSLDDVCRLGECKYMWAEEVLIVAVIVSHIVGFKWDGRLIDKWIQSMIKAAREKAKNDKKENSAQTMEKGEVVVDEEKRELMANDGSAPAADIEKAALLVDIEETTTAEQH